MDAAFVPTLEKEEKELNDAKADLKFKKRTSDNKQKKLDDLKSDKKGEA